MAEIKKSDVIEEAAIKAPLEMSANMQTLVGQLDKYVATAGKITKASDEETKSLVKLGDASKKIVKLNQDFAKTQDELTKQVKKNNDELTNQQKKTNESSQTTTKYVNEMRKLKQELKETESELVKIAKTSGTNSAAFQNAANKAGQLKDEMDDIRDAIKNTSASPFENIATQLGNVGGKLKGLDFQGAKAAAQQLASESGKITFKTALSGIKDFSSTLMTAGKAILTNPLFLLTAVLLGIGVAAYKLRDSIKPLKIAIDLVGSAFDYVVQKGKDFLDYLGFTTFALDKQKQETIDFASKEIETLTKYYDEKIKLAEAFGKDVEDIEKKKWEAIGNAAYSGLKETLDDQLKVRAGMEEKNKSLSEAFNQASLELELIAIRNGVTEQQKIRLAKIRETHSIIKNEFAKFYAESKRFVDADTSAYIIGEDEKLNALLSHLDKMVKADEEAQKKLSDNQYEQRARRRHDLEDDLTNVLSIEQELGSNVIAIANDITTARMQNLELEKQAVDAKYKTDLANAGDNKRAQLQVEREYQAQLSVIKAKELEEKRRMAIFDKANALLQASLKEALLILEALTGNPRAIIAAVAGGLQVAAIAGKLIPKYAEGRSDGPAELAIVNEQGPELICDADGSAHMYDTEGAVMTTLKAGSKVFTASETDSIVNSGLRGISPVSFQREQKKSNALLLEIGALRRDMRNKKTVEINISRAGMELMVRKAETRTKFMGDLYA